jgi:regulatory protein
MEEERFLAGRKKAMALLLHKDRTRWELCDRLVRAGFEDDVVEDAIAYVESFHYIDDRRYAVRFAEIYCESRSIKRIRQDLMKRHVPEKYIEDAFEQIQWDDSGALTKELNKLLKGRELSEDISYEEKQKIAAKLYRKGFQTDDIIRELDHLK